MCTVAGGVGFRGLVVVVRTHLAAARDSAVALFEQRADEGGAGQLPRHVHVTVALHVRVVAVQPGSHGLRHTRARVEDVRRVGGRRRQ